MVRRSRSPRAAAHSARRIASRVLRLPEILPDRKDGWIV
ncbi:hypothetical protein CLV78_101492 [Aliiruegeria haliotis]|uniref:Uncharacterized protein n=1 Tax=Aliiruegeria haliotis TaxID=1280846 RepID=A0A2T0RZ01_9RHOB|nr:hypothetical protein CLV78_101492 [Aliiruegeria haliotis]